MHHKALENWLEQHGSQPPSEFMDKSTNESVSESEKTTLTHHDYADRHTFEIVSKVAFLCGVKNSVFENEFEAPQLEEYRKLILNKNARIVRNLCILRTNIIRNFGKINKEMRFNFKSVTSLPEFVPQDAILQLSNDGITLFTNKRAKLVDHLIELNRHISDRINNCKQIFPVWLCWEYIRDLFVVPNGTTEAGTKVASEQYYENRDFYPYQVFINWPVADYGNIFLNDAKFTKLLYEWNCDEFVDTNKVSDVGEFSKSKFRSFLSEGGNAVMVVDCENSDPIDLCSALNGFDAEVLAKIKKIILFDDIHTTTVWDTFENHVQIPVEHITIDRVKSNKSLVDVKLITGVCKEFYSGLADTFLLVSSDSDYWGLIDSLPDARFLVMIEHEKCGPDLKNALSDSDIFYCYIDDFYSADSGTELQTSALLLEMQQYLKQNFHLNLNDMLDDALYATRLRLCNAERKQFYDRYLRTIQMRIDETGEVTLEFNIKK